MVSKMRVIPIILFYVDWAMEYLTEFGGYMQLSLEVLCLHDSHRSMHQLCKRGTNWQSGGQQCRLHLMG